MEKSGRTSTGLDHGHWQAYKPLRREYPDHRIVDHLIGEYVDGEIHSNTIEGFFGNLKTRMRSAYKKVSRKWLQSYLDA